MDAFVKIKPEKRHDIQYEHMTVRGPYESPPHTELQFLLFAVDTHPRHPLIPFWNEVITLFANGYVPPRCCQQVHNLLQTEMIPELIDNVNEVVPYLEKPQASKLVSVAKKTFRVNAATQPPNATPETSPWLRSLPKLTAEQRQESLYVSMIENDPVTPIDSIRPMHPFYLSNEMFLSCSEGSLVEGLPAELPVSPTNSQATAIINTTPRPPPPTPLPFPIPAHVQQRHIPYRSPPKPSPDAMMRTPIFYRQSPLAVTRPVVPQPTGLAQPTPHSFGSSDSTLPLTPNLLPSARLTRQRPVGAGLRNPWDSPLFWENVRANEFFETEGMPGASRAGSTSHNTTVHTGDSDRSGRFHDPKPPTYTSDPPPSERRFTEPHPPIYSQTIHSRPPPPPQGGQYTYCSPPRDQPPRPPRRPPAPSTHGTPIRPPRPPRRSPPSSSHSSPHRDSDDDPPDPIHHPLPPDDDHDSDPSSHHSHQPRRQPRRNPELQLPFHRSSIRVTPATVPPFYGEPSRDSVTIQAFCRKIDMMRRAQVPTLSSHQTALYAQLMLRGVASKWLENKQDSLDTSVEHWTTREDSLGLQKQLMKRFMPDITLAQHCELSNNLILQKGEPLLDFFDRCEETQITLLKDFTPVVARRSAIEGAIRVSYINGLPAIIREKLLEMMESDTIEELRIKSRRIENSQNDRNKTPMQRPAQLFAVDNDQAGKVLHDPNYNKDAAQAAVDAITEGFRRFNTNYQRGRGSSRNRPQYRRGFQRGRGRGQQFRGRFPQRRGTANNYNRGRGRPQFSRKPAQEMLNKYGSTCAKCGQQGHWQQDCYVNARRSNVNHIADQQQPPPEQPQQPPAYQAQQPQMAIIDSNTYFPQ